MTQIRTGSGCSINIAGKSVRGTYVTTFNPNSGLPTTGSGAAGAIRKGDYWDASTSGTIAGLNITSVETGDLLFAKVNGATLASQFILNKAQGNGAGSVTLASLGTTLQTAADDTPLDADTWNFYDAVDTILKKITWANIKATLKTYFDGLYVALTGDQTIAGVKTFSSSPIVPTPTTATQAANKSYVDTSVTGLLDLKGSTDCSANPNYPSASKGDSYYVTVAGKIGGASGKSVDVGDVYIASADNAGGTEASVGTSWFVLEHNLAGALLSANNLSDLANAGTARTNLGLGSLATKSTIYSLNFTCAQSTPADATTYYIGNTNAVINTTAKHKVYVPIAGTITNAQINWYSQSAAGTSESFSIYIRVNDTTDYLIETSGLNSDYESFINNSLSIAVVQGDFLNIKIVTPTWATNPTAVFISGYVVIT